MYEYNCRIVRVIDGDTVHVDVDLGVDVHVGMTVRLAGINCPELSTPEGVAAKDFTAAWFEANISTTGTFILETVKDRREKYGRYLGYIYPSDIVFEDGEDLNNQLVRSGNAVLYP